ncbi:MULTISPECIES: methionine ABC transporter ATP-binding protein [Paenibacillus]|uniref:ATP-binding cassette domain-containing protein n=5 Tax=Paenibacillus validus TaxID=44253 RepID=A0A7X3CSQ2_9BACL|nr:MULTISPECIES: methionine ABC transporter ATP-binding protein [Paenibacillus]MUG72040.1 ATP-binding cassette domain-containing protein [Paenibacillus validus]
MIQLSNVSKTYQVGDRSIAALRNIDLTVNKGEIFGIIGHSGAGKSTLIRTINVLEQPTGGQVFVDGVEMTALNGRRLQQERSSIGMIFQHFNLLSSATVADNIAFPLRLAKQQPGAVERRVRELLQLVGLEEHGAKYPAQLSGGQKQRVGIARALATSPKVLLCDEATSALDPQTTNSILALLLDINRKLHITIVLITHEMHVIRSICDRVAVIDGGKIVELGPVTDVFLKPQHPTTREFVEQLSDSSEPLQAASSPAHERTIVRITYLGEQTYAPILYETMREASVPLVILQGTISRIKDTPYGQMVVEIQGGRADAEETVALLRSRGLDVEVIRYG